jgi:hypothetical protein
MARKRMTVTVHDPDPAKLPDTLAEAALVLVDLEARGVVNAVASRLQIRRQGGYPAVDVWLSLLIYLCGDVNQGFRPFWEVLGRHVKQMAALAGRKRLPSPASVSRALDSVENELLRETAPWLLTEAPGVDAVLRHPAVLTYDAHGHGWHVFDLDPTVRTIRHRALPEGEDLPEPMRRSEETGAPGHSGRKRGDIQFRRVDVQHAGSGIWTHAHLHPGNGDGAADLERALQSVTALVQRLDHPLERTLVRMDGEHGSVPYFSACRARGLPFVTRLNRPKLYEDPDVLARLRQATWHEVPDSGSGPQRAAADLGVLTLHPDRKTKRPDGRRYEPVKLRVVASIFPKEAPAQRGRLLDGWQVELFAADLPADAWPAQDVVAAYFGRAGQENRFAQEDREVGLDRIVSYHLPGQELATLTGLFLLNYRIARGFELDPPPSVRPPPTLRRARVDARVPKEWPRDPVVSTLLNRIDWPALLVGRSDWQWDAVAGVLRCPDGRELTLTSVRPEPYAPGRTQIIFRRPAGGCEACPARAECFCSNRANAVKHLELSVPREIADPLRERLALVRGKVEPARRVELSVIEAAAGIHAVLAPRFLPAAARQRFRQIFAGATLRVEVRPPEPAPPRPRLVAMDEADRQRRRSTWAARAASNALPEDAEVGLEVFTRDPDLRRLLSAPPRADVAVGGWS